MGLSGTVGDGGGDTQNLPNFKERFAVGPLVNDFHKFPVETVHIFVLVYRQLRFLGDLGDGAGLILDFPEGFGKFVPCQGGGLLRLLLKHEHTDNRCDLFRRKVVEETVEQKLTEHQLITRTYFTRHTCLQLNDIRFVEESESTEHPSATLQLFKLHDGHGVLNLILGVLDLITQLHLLGVLLIQLWQPWRIMQGVRKETGFENFNFLYLAVSINDAQWVK